MVCVREFCYSCSNGNTWTLDHEKGWNQQINAFWNHFREENNTWSRTTKQLLPVQLVFHFPIWFQNDNGINWNSLNHTEMSLDCSNQAKWGRKYIYKSNPTYNSFVPLAEGRKKSSVPWIIHFYNTIKPDSQNHGDRLMGSKHTDHDPSTHLLAFYIPTITSIFQANCSLNIGVPKLGPTEKWISLNIHLTILTPS